MKQYTFEIIVSEGSNEFWEEVTENGQTGCDDVLEAVKAAFDEVGLEPDIKLVKYEDK